MIDERTTECVLTGAHNHWVIDVHLDLDKAYLAIKHEVEGITSLDTLHISFPEFNISTLFPLIDDIMDKIKFISHTGNIRAMILSDMMGINTIEEFDSTVYFHGDVLSFCGYAISNKLVSADEERQEGWFNKLLDNLKGGLLTDDVDYSNSYIILRTIN